MSAVDLLFPLLHKPVGIILQVNDVGVNNYLEFATDEIHLMSIYEYHQSAPEKARGVFGYFSWGFKAIQLDKPIFWYEPEYINWRHVTAVPPEKSWNALRIWMRKNVHATFTLLDTGSDVGGILLSPTVP